VIDAWFDSGSMPFAQFHHPFAEGAPFEERFPADYICEGLDQTRGWFYSLLAVSTLVFDQTSYLNCVCLGLILDPDGQKMSKSRDNVVDPWAVISEHGADALRWYYFTAQQPWSGYRFSSEVLGETVRPFFTTLWNTYSFLVLYVNASDTTADDLAGFQPLQDTSNPLDRWAISRLQTVTQRVIDDMDRYDCTSAGRAIAAYVEELSNWYVRLSRRRFWDADNGAFMTLRHCLLEVTKLLAPFIPFVSDEIHGNLAGPGAPDSVHLADHPVPDESLRDAALEARMDAVRRAVELGRAARSQARVKVRQPLGKAVIVAQGAEREAIEAMGDLVRAELNVKELEFVSDEAELVSYEVKPNFRTLGPRFGKHMPQAAAAVGALDPAHAAEAIRGERRLGINLDGHEHELAPDDLTLVMQPLEGYEVEAEAGRAVALALELSDELRREGLAREVVHAVQAARKEAGLEVTDRITLALAGDDAIVEAAREHEAYVANETLATSVAYGDGEATEPVRIEGLELRIGVERAQDPPGETPS
jgi:isoleucyl-tRNA synthetase